MKAKGNLKVWGTLLAVVLFFTAAMAVVAGQSPASRLLADAGARRGLVVLLGKARADQAVPLAKASELMLYVQTSTPAEALEARQQARTAGLLGTRIFIDEGPWDRIQLADGIADAVLAADGLPVTEAEVLRVLRPGGKAKIGARALVKKAPEGTDTWSHPYHGPDNNTQSHDHVARSPYLTQFLADPLFSSQPEVTVAAGGRIFKAFGHIAFKAYQNTMINSLHAFSAYNGAELWRREIKPGFMIHRNTMIATPDLLYMADDESCKVFDAATGKLKKELRPRLPDGEIGAVWKWMALDGGVLYALLGGPEVNAPKQLGTGNFLAGWPWGMWPGFDYKDPERAWGFGRDFVALDAKTGKVLWNYHDSELADARGVCLKDGRIYFFQPQKMLGCLDAKTGSLAWRSTDRAMLDAIGTNTKAQIYTSGFSTSCYIKTDGRRLIFAGPQRPSLTAVSATDGKLLWSRPVGNFQVIMLQDALYAAGEQNKKSYKIDYATGESLAEFPDRRACTRATATDDGIFFRAKEGTVRWNPETSTTEHIAPMRPGCHDGVIVSDGRLLWGPWICGCHLTLVGMISLGPAGDFNFAPAPDEAAQLHPGVGPLDQIKLLDPRPSDWTGYQGGSARPCRTEVPLAENLSKLWTVDVSGKMPPTAPIAVGGLVFVAGADGVVRALDAATGRKQWQAMTGGSIFFPPEFARGRLYAGSNDGRVYCYEAATGRELWRFRLGPADRKIPAYGELISTWPVAGGVVAGGDTLYAAAGITHYDGTHVYALDAATGRVKWHNGESGRLDPKVGNGISLCGRLALEGGALTFPGGNVYETASFDAASGKCLNQPAGMKTVKRVLLFPRKIWEPIAAATHATELGQIRVSTRPAPKSRESTSVNAVLGLYKMPANTPAIARRPLSRVSDRAAVPKTDAPLPRLSDRAPVPRTDAPLARQPLPKPIWAINLSSYQGSIVAGDKLLVLGRPQTRLTREGQTGLLLLRLADGEVLWQQSLPATPVPWGVAVDGAGRIIVTMENGQAIAFGPK